MPDMSQAFSGKWMKAQDLPQPKVLTITDIEKAQFPSGSMGYSLGFEETHQRLGLNQTNGQTLLKLYGQFSEQWAGKQIEAFATTVEMQGQTRPCVRLRAPSQAQQPQQAGGVQQAFGQQQQPPAQPNDGIPF